VSHAFAQEPQSSTEAVVCDFNAPEPLLLASAYGDYRFTAKPNNGSTESVALARGMRLEIRQSSCVDSVDQEIILTVPHAAHDIVDMKFWADFMQRELARLKTRADDAGTVKSFAEFLAQAPAHDVHNGKVLWCRDGSAAPDEECGWSTGGVYLLEIKRSGKAVVIDAAQSTSQ